MVHAVQGVCVCVCVCVCVHVCANELTGLAGRSCVAFRAGAGAVERVTPPRMYARAVARTPRSIGTREAC